MSEHTDRELTTQTVTGIASSGNTRSARRAGIFSKHFRLASGLFFLVLSTSLVAETHFCVGGDLDHMTPAAIAACRAKMSGVRDAAKQRGVPAGWHFVVVCDEAGWKEYASFSHEERGLLTGAGYSTDPQLRWTFLRGSALDANQPEATATILSTSLESVPNQKGAPQLAPAASKSRQLSIAMASHESSRPDSQ